MSRLAAPKKPMPPVSKQISYTASYHGQEISDPWHWLRDPGYPDVQDRDVLAYLKEENDYFDAVMGEKASLKDKIFQEIRGRMKDDDEGVPWRDGDFDYKWAFTPGAEYRTWYYRPSGTDRWQILFDEMAAAKSKDFFRLKDIQLSPDHHFLSTSVDDNGSERFTIKLAKFETGETLGLAVAETSGEVVWDDQSNGFFYVVVSREWRPYLVRWQSVDGGAPIDIYEEKDSRFFVHIARSSNRKNLIVTSATHVTSEVYLLPLDAPQDRLQNSLTCLAPRRDKHQYSVDVAEAGIWILSNRDHQNFGLYLCKGGAEGEAGWVQKRIGDDRRYLHGFQVQKKYLYIEERQNGQDNIIVLSSDGDMLDTLKCPEFVRTVGLGHNPEYDQDHVRINYTSLITPVSVYDVDPVSGQWLLRKQQEIPSGYDGSDYESERIMVPVRGGVMVPVSLVYKVGWKKRSNAPLHLYGYGAYGLGMSPSFSAARLSLLDRGFAYAIAHIRGGDELGYGWYEDGKLENRENSFNDFVDVARYLIDTGHVRKQRITISGGSAGGELMGAAVNQAADLFGAAVLHVPFVDVLNTMLDATLPLTPMEWPEWGNPLESKDAFNTIQAYCPYTNIQAQHYPPMLVTGGLNDPRVTYWEPAKWTAKLRALKTDDHLLVMKMNMGAGHAGKSGRFESIGETAEEYIFLLMALGLDE